jgi:hypothetical protein
LFALTIGIAQFTGPVFGNTAIFVEERWEVFLTELTIADNFRVDRSVETG